MDIVNACAVVVVGFIVRFYIYVILYLLESFDWFYNWFENWKNRKRINCFICNSIAPCSHPQQMHHYNVCTSSFFLRYIIQAHKSVNRTHLLFKGFM